MLQTLVYAESSSRGRPYFGYSFGYGAKIVCKLTFGPVSVSANVGCGMRDADADYRVQTASVVNDNRC